MTASRLKSGTYLALTMQIEEFGTLCYTHSTKVMGVQNREHKCQHRLSEASTVVRCRVCQTKYVTNTVYCSECGAYLLEPEELETEPMEMAQINWLGNIQSDQSLDVDLPRTGPLGVRLIIGKGAQQRELEVLLVKPIRLGRSDPTQNIFPEVDLTDDLAMESGVSREHAAIFGRGAAVMVEDLGSTNGSLLNGERLDPYMPEPLQHGDQLQLGQLLIEVRLR
jgi:ribosomal protein S27E